MERALLLGERRAELDQVEAELEIINQLQLKLNEVEKTIQKEKEKVNRAHIIAKKSLAQVYQGILSFPGAFCFVVSKEEQLYLP